MEGEIEEETPQPKAEKKKKKKQSTPVEEKVKSIFETF